MSKLEKYEWESLWWEEPENKNKRHILYIGDSISNGTTKKLNELEETLAVDNFATSKAVDNPCFIKSLEHTVLVTRVRHIASRSVKMPFS